jgi:CSLREA domain-containing protein
VVIVHSVTARLAVVAILALSIAFLSLPALPASADAVFNVTTSDDHPDNNVGDGVCETELGLCSLRAAVQEANLLPGNHTINVPGQSYGVEFGFERGEDAAAEGDLDINGAITINGAGSDGNGPSTFIYGSNWHRVFDILGGTVTISGVIIYSGGGDRGVGCDCGGGVYVHQGAGLTLSDSILTQNSAETDGGAIYNAGSLTIASTEAAFNWSYTGSGGAIYNVGTLTLTDSALLTNITETSGPGGAIANQGTLLITNSTIGGNSAAAGGGISTISPGTTEISSSTIYGNYGGGLLINGSTTLRNTIVAGHAANGGLNCSFGTVISAGHNLEDANACGLTGAGDKANTDPQVGPVAYDGATQTHPLLAGSPAVDSGDSGPPGSGGTSCPSTDQRGVARPVDGDSNATAICDIGAYEYVDGDADADNHTNWTEGVCGSDSGNAGSIPERTDGPFAGVSDDGDAQVDEPLPPGSSNYDCDGDGYTGNTESDVTTSDQDACGFNGWPSDLSPDGSNIANLQDLASFIAPVRRLGSSSGQANFSVRWDVVPGAAAGKSINLQDMAALLTGTTGYPPMFDGQRAFGRPCPWPQ